MPKFDPALPLLYINPDISIYFQSIAEQLLGDVLDNEHDWIEDFYEEYSQNQEHPNSLLIIPPKHHLVTPLEKIVTGEDGISYPRVYPQKPGRYRLLLQMCFRDFIYRGLTDDEVSFIQTKSDVVDYFLWPFDPAQPLAVLPLPIRDAFQRQAQNLLHELQSNKVTHPVLLRKDGALHDYECFKSEEERNPSWYSSLFNDNSFERDRSAFLEKHGKVPKIYCVESPIRRTTVYAILHNIIKGKDKFSTSNNNSSNYINWSVQYLLRDLIFTQLTDGYEYIDGTQIPPDSLVNKFFYEQKEKDFLSPVDHFGRYDFVPF